MRISHFLLVITMAVLCSIATAASAECPLKSNAITTWTIDSVDPKNTNAACLDNQGGDCSLHGVVGKINKVVPAECGAAIKDKTLTNATLVLKFKGALEPVTSIELDIGLIIHVYPGVKLVIDGDLGKGKRFTLRKDDQFQIVLDVHCKYINQANALQACDKTITTASLELRNLSLEKGKTAIRVLSGLDATFPNITLEHIDCINQKETGVHFTNLKADNLTVSDVTVENHTSGTSSNGFIFSGVNLIKGVLQHVGVSRAGKSVNAIGINFYNQSSIAGLTIDDAQILGVGKALQFVGTKDGYKNVTITNSVLGTHEYPVINTPIVFKATGNLLKINNVQSVGGDAAGIFLESSSPTDALTNVQIMRSRFEQATHGIWIQGNVQTVTVEDVELLGKVETKLVDGVEQTTSVGENGIYVKAVANIPEPRKIVYWKTRFRNLKTPAKYDSLALNAYTDTVYEAPGMINSINLGLDTPANLTVFRDSKKPQWFRVEFSHSEKVEDGALFWVHEGAWYPMQMTTAGKKKAPCQNGLCTFYAESQFDADHLYPPPTLAGVPVVPAPYTGQPLEELSVATMVSADGNASMLSEPQSLLSPNWTDQEILTVDTQTDDVLLRACTTKPDDCSLRGAIALAKEKRTTQKLTHPFVVRFAEDLVAIPLSSALTIDVNDIKLEGVTSAEDTMPIIIFPNAEGITELVIMANQQQTLSHLWLDGQGNVATAVKSVGAANLILGSTIVNTTGDAIRAEQVQPPAAGQPVPHLFVFNSTLGLFGGKGVSMAKDNLVYLKKIRLAKTDPSVSPSFLVSGAAKAPTFIQSTELIYPALPGLPITVTVYGEVDAPLTTVYGYVRFPNDAQWELFPITTQEFLPGAGKVFKAIFSLPDDVTPSVLLQSQNMTLYMMGELAKNGELVTTNLSGGAELDFSKSDYDKDGVMDKDDNAPTAANPDQLDSDGDKIGDAGDPDLDGDGKDNGPDNCPAVKNADQIDTDSDGLGNACDPDIDGDGVPNDADLCKFDADFDLVGGLCIKDLDKDTVADDLDNCLGLANTPQFNSDGDGQGDACDTDDDNDGIVDADDNCPVTANTGQTDTDSDTQGDGCDNDDDGDGVDDITDNCLLLSNADQVNGDDDALGNLCDLDDDNDAVADAQDNCPLVVNPVQDNADSDGLGDACDPDTPKLPITPPTAPGTVDEQLQVDGAAPLPDGGDDNEEQPAAKPDDSTPPPTPEPAPAVNAESGGCSLMLR